MKRRLLSALLSIVMIFTIALVPVNAAAPTKVEFVNIKADGTEASSDAEANGVGLKITGTASDTMTVVVVDGTSMTNYETDQGDAYDFATKDLSDFKSTFANNCYASDAEFEETLGADGTLILKLRNVPTGTDTLTAWVYGSGQSAAAATKAEAPISGGKVLKPFSATIGNFSTAPTAGTGGTCTATVSVTNNTGAEIAATDLSNATNTKIEGTNSTMFSITTPFASNIANGATGTCVVTFTSQDATTAGTYTATLTVGDGTNTATIDLSVTVLAPFTVVFDDLTQTYDGTPKAATITSVTDAGVAVTGYTVTYTGTAGTTYAESETAPTNAGSYTVTVKKGDKSGTDTLTIQKANLTVEAEDSTVAPGTALTEDLFLKAAAATPLGTGNAMASLFSGAVTSGSASTNGVTVTFYEWDEGTPAVPCTCPGGVHDANNTDCHQAAAVPATWKALAANPTEAGTYKFTVGVAAAGTFKTNYNLAALTAGTPTLTDENATFDGTLTIENNAPVVPTNNFTVTYNAGLHGSLAAGSATSEKVKKGEKPVNVPEVVAEKGYTFVGWSADGRTLVKPAEETITRSVTFTALYADHNAYMVGRSTTTFEPNGQMTRAEAAAVLSRLTAGFEEDGEYTAAPYSDLDTSAWYITYVNFAAEKGIIKGYEDGTFRPNAPITRAELATMIAGYMKVAAIDDPAVSSDVAGHWAEGLIAALEKAQVIKGYEDGTFRPNQNITRAEAATMVNGAIDREPQVVDLAGDGYVNPFTDVAESDWFFKEVMEATVAHLIAHFHAA